MLRYSLEMQQVTLPGHPRGWPPVLDLEIGLHEILLLEGVNLPEAEALHQVASTLEGAVAGLVRHWGQDAAALSRQKLYNLRRQIAYFSANQVLLHRLTIGENITLGPRYHEGLSHAAALGNHAELLAYLEIEPYLGLLPSQVNAEIYGKALFAREMIRQPELLLLAAPEATTHHGVTPAMLVLWLRYFLETHPSAALITGRSLKVFYPLAHRLWRLRPPGHFTEHRFLRPQDRPLVNFLRLV